MMVPLSGTSTGSAGKASPHLQAWLDKKKAAEEKQRVLEGIRKREASSTTMVDSLLTWKYSGGKERIESEGKSNIQTDVVSKGRMGGGSEGSKGQAR